MHETVAVGDPGEGQLRRAGRRRLPGGRAAEHASTWAGWPPCAGRSAPSRCSRPRWPGCPPGRRPLRRHPLRRAAARGPRRGTRPPRSTTPRPPPGRRPTPAPPGRLGGLRAGAAFARRSPRGGPPRGLVGAARRDWPGLLADAAAATFASGRGALLCVPDRKDVARVDAALTDLLGAGRHVVLTADLGPAERYRAFLAVSRGRVRVVVGTRAAAFAPVHDLGLVAIWDDGDDLYAEPRAPYPHAREVLLIRAHEEGAAALLGGFARTVEAEYLVRTGWAETLAARPGRAAGRAPRRCRSPAPPTASSSATRTPAPPGCRARPTTRSATGSTRGPVLVQTPRQGYATALACDTCRTPARCTVCTGPLRLTAAHQPPSCRWCGGRGPRLGLRRVCGGHGLRAPVLGDRRTAEELGRAFPQVAGADLRRRPGARHRRRTDRRSWSRPRAPSRSPRAATPRGAARHLADARPAPTCAPPRRRCAAGSPRPRWPGPPAEGGRVVAVGEPGRPGAAGAGAVGPGRVRRPRARGPAVRAPAAGVPAGHADRPRGRPASALAALSCRPAPRCSARCRSCDRPAPDAEAPAAAAGRRPGAPRRGRRAVRTLHEMQGVRSARKLPPVRVQVDPVGLE